MGNFIGGKVRGWWEAARGDFSSPGANDSSSDHTANTNNEKLKEHAKYFKMEKAETSPKSV